MDRYFSQSFLFGADRFLHIFTVSFERLFEIRLGKGKRLPCRARIYAPQGLEIGEILV